MPIDARHGLVWCGYTFALASMAYSLISAFATRKIFSAAPANREALPPVTILKPLYGAEPETYECLRSFCEQAYPQYQVIFGVCDPQDPAVAVVHRRETLARIGGFNSVSNQLADDYRLGELTRQLGLRTVLSDLEVDTLVEDCTAAGLVAHELRWRRTIRNLNPYGYVFSVVTLGPPVTALQLLFTQGAAPAAAIFSATAVASALIHLNARRSGASTAVLLLVPFRDLLHFGLWIWSFATRRVHWGDDRYEVSRDGAAQPIEGLGQ